MKKIALLIGVIICVQSNAQDSTFNKSAIEVNVGANLATNYYTAGYHPSKIGSISSNIAYRYMLNNKFGVRFSGTFSNLKNSSSTSNNSLPFSSKVVSLTTEGVINLARVLNFETFSSKIGLTFHAGVGLSSLKNESSSYFKWYTKNNSDEMVHFVYGIKPSYRLSNKLLLNLDYSYYSYSAQASTFDLMSTPNEKGFVGNLGTLTVGLTIHLGKNENHIDDYVTDVKVDLKPLEDKLKTLEDQQLDDDKDGVPNYLDLEKDTPENAKVNTKGQKIEAQKIVTDSDNDGITDEFDQCPTKKGLFSNDGCPAEKLDAVNAAPIKLQFESDATQLTSESKISLLQLVEKIKTSNVHEITLKGYADERGSDDYNMNLSRKRAEAIKKELVKIGIEQNVIVILALGESNPINPNSTPEAYASNRRVEVILK